MNCKKCGVILEEGVKFCGECGEPVNGEITNTNIEETNYVEKPKKKKGFLHFIKKIFIGMGTFILVIVLLVVRACSASKKMVCTSDNGNITLMYNDSSLIGYTSNGISFDLTSQQELAYEVGIDLYLESFNEWFTTNTSGTCTK